MLFAYGSIKKHPPVRGKHDFTHGNLMNMKVLKTVAAIAAIVVSAGCSRQTVGVDEYLIKGVVRNIPDSTVISLMRSDGRLAVRVAQDTVIGGRFEFRDTISGGAVQFGLCSFGKGFPNNILPVWVKPGVKVTVTGEDNLLLTWRVKSRLPEQKAENDFLAVQFPEKRESQVYAVEEADMLRELRGLSGEERRAAWRKVDSLRRLCKPLDSIANHKVLEYMRTAPVTTKWLDELALHAMMLSGGYGKADSALVYELYSRLTPEDLKTRPGEVISATLSPRKVVGVGDDLVDGDLYDTDGNVHHLSEFSGKYILLDFWSVGCGPCMESIPEGNELAREFADRLAFVRLSVDGEKTWKKVLKKVLKEEKSDCVEWNEFKPMGAGLSASYQANGIPHFVLISPEAKVIDIWTGYGKGSLRSRLLRHLGSE